MVRWILLGAVLAACGGCGGKRSADNAGGDGSSLERGVILFPYAEGSESTGQREQGFLNTLEKEFPQFAIISSDQYGGPTASRALDRSQQLLDKFGDRVTGIFACNESNCIGMLRALQEKGLVGKVAFIGFDSSPNLVRALEKREMQGIVLQNPVKMGYLAVMTMADHLAGKPVEKRVNTGELVATPENMHQEEVRARLSPQQFQEGASTRSANPKYRIGVIPKGNDHDFWKSVHAGVEQAAAERGDIEVLWQAPAKQDDKQDQISVVQNFVATRVDGICLAPVDAQALIEPVKQAKVAGIPTVIFDSGLADESILVSYVATDNYNGGVLAARRLGEVLVAQEKQEKK